MEMSAEALEFSKMVVATVMGKAVTQGQLSAAFDRVADKANWKNPINAVVVLKTHREMAMIKEAVRFFAGCQAKFEAVELLGARCRYRVTAKGYYLAVGA